MEISTPLPPTATTVKTPDPESELPQSNTVITKQLPPLLTNSTRKSHKHFHNHNHQPPPLIVVTYKECLKNHAAVLGGYAIDGCGEFMSSPSSSPTYPTSLKCAACGCHRNFHRRELEESLFTPPIQHVIEYQPHDRHHSPPPQQLLLPPPSAGDVSPGNSPSPPPISSSYYPSAPHMLLALNTGLSSPPEKNNHNPTTPVSSNPNGKKKFKRFRTKFSQNQKDKMYEIAERIGWKMQNRDEEMINGFCNEIGVEKNVFKVWMHNNKTTTLAGNTTTTTTNSSTFINNGNGNVNHTSIEDHANRGIDFISRNNNHHDLHLYNNDRFSTGGNLFAIKGSSSS